MEYYDEQDLQEIVLRSSDIFKQRSLKKGHWKLLADHEERLESLIACSNGFVILRKSKETGKSIVLADQALTLLQVDQAGLDYVDQKLLRTMIELYGGGPVGLSTLSVNIGEERETVEDMYEPYLIQKDFKAYT